MSIMSVDLTDTRDRSREIRRENPRKPRNQTDTGYDRRVITRRFLPQSDDFADSFVRIGYLGVVDSSVPAISNYPIAVSFDARYYRPDAGKVRIRIRQIVDVQLELHRSNRPAGRFRELVRRLRTTAGDDDLSGIETCQISRGDPSDRTIATYDKD